MTAPPNGLSGYVVGEDYNVPGFELPGQITDGLPMTPDTDGSSGF